MYIIFPQWLGINNNCIIQFYSGMQKNSIFKAFCFMTPVLCSKGSMFFFHPSMKTLKCKSTTTHGLWLLSCSELTSSLKLASVLFPTEICKVTFSTSYKELTFLAPWLCIMHLVHFNVLLLFLHTRMLCKQLTESKVLYLSLLIDGL